MTGQTQTLAASDNAPAGKAAGSVESTLRAAHIPDGSLCVCGHASAAGASSPASRPIIYRRGRGARRGRPLRIARSFPGQAARRAFGAAEALRKPFHVERAYT